MEIMTKKLDSLLSPQAKPDKVAAYSEPGKRRTDYETYSRTDQ